MNILMFLVLFMSRLILFHQERVLEKHFLDWDAAHGMTCSSYSLTLQTNLTNGYHPLFYLSGRHGMGCMYHTMNGMHVSQGMMESKKSPTFWIFLVSILTLISLLLLLTSSIGCSPLSVGSELMCF